MIAIIDYVIGNVQSVKNAVQHLGFKCELVDDKTALKSYSYLILLVRVLNCYANFAR